jgi:hypothetical protein
MTAWQAHVFAEFEPQQLLAGDFLMSFPRASKTFRFNRRQPDRRPFEAL